MNTTTDNKNAINGKISGKWTEYKGCYINKEGYLIQLISTEKGYIEEKYGPPLQLIKD